MGDFADDCRDAAFMEAVDLDEAVRESLDTIDDEQVVKDMIQEFREHGWHMTTRLEDLARDILRTIARTKRISRKQKSVLLQVLYMNGADGYEY